MLRYQDVNIGVAVSHNPSIQCRRSSSDNVLPIVTPSKKVLTRHFNDLFENWISHERYVLENGVNIRKLKFGRRRVDAHIMISFK